MPVRGGSAPQFLAQHNAIMSEERGYLFCLGWVPLELISKIALPIDIRPACAAVAYAYCEAPSG